MPLAPLAVPVDAPAPFTSAHWIAPPPGVVRPYGTPLFRREFRLDGAPRKATLRIIGLGDFDVTVNGKRATPTGINQPWSQYERTLYWSDIEVGRLLRAGANCIGVALGASFWHNPNPPAGRYNKDGPQRTTPEPYLLCAELLIDAPDGSPTRLATDAAWRVHEGPVTFSHVYAGEDFDARLSVRGWDTAGHKAGDWRPAREVASPEAALRARDWPGFASFEAHKPTEARATPDGKLHFAFPQNMSAQLRVRLTGGKPGDRVVFRCGEHRSPEGKLFGGYVVDCSVTTDGKPVDRRWQFFYLGMQFVEASGAVLPGAPNPQNLPVISSLELIHVRNGLPQSGAFRSSSDLLNHTHDLIDWAIRSNMSWVMTDCPHREKLGWLECAYLLAPSFQYRYEGRGWFAKIARDIRDAQEPDGMVRTVAPSYPAGRFPGAFDWTVEWGAAAVMTPWLHYEWYGDPTILRDSLASMRGFTDYVGSVATHGIAPKGLGDWYDYGHGHGPGPSRFTPTDLSSTATWALCALTVSRAAEALGDSATATRYRDLHARIGESFQRVFQDPTTRLLRHLGSPQCANAMAICAEVVPESDRPALVADIVADLEKRGWQQTPGDVGHVYLIRALAEAGRSDVLHRVYARTGLGSYGGILAKNLTSLPETWDAMMDGYQSRNHCMLGHVMEWIYGYVGGIRQAPGSVGWREALVAPVPGPLTSATASVRTPKGPISCAWTAGPKGFRMEVSAPGGVRVTAVLPSGRRTELKPGKTVLQEP